MYVSLGLIENIQQQVFGGGVLLCVSSVQINEGALEVRSHFRERSELDQVQEVQVLQSACALALGLRRVEALTELLHVWTPERLPPTLFKKTETQMNTKDHRLFWKHEDEAFTVQQVLCTQMDVNAAVKAGYEPIENSLLQTQTCINNRTMWKHINTHFSIELHTLKDLCVFV